MALALMLQELNAANFSSGNAATGDVLTADGDGGAEWGRPIGLFPEIVSTNIVIPASYSTVVCDFTVGSGGSVTVDGTLYVV